MLITVALLLLKIENRKELHQEVKLNGGPLRDLKWLHSNPYIMPQLAGLFWHTILFAKFNILISFNPLPWKYWGSTHPYMISQWNKGIVPPIYKDLRDLILKAFHATWRQNFFFVMREGEEMNGRRVLHRWSMIWEC